MKESKTMVGMHRNIIAHHFILCLHVITYHTQVYVFIHTFTLNEKYIWVDNALWQIHRLSNKNYLGLPEIGAEELM